MVVQALDLSFNVTDGQNANIALTTLSLGRRARKCQNLPLMSKFPQMS